MYAYTGKLTTFFTFIFVSLALWQRKLAQNQEKSVEAVPSIRKLETMQYRSAPKRVAEKPNSKCWGIPRNLRSFRFLHQIWLEPEFHYSKSTNILSGTLELPFCRFSDFSGQKMFFINSEKIFWKNRNEGSCKFSLMSVTLEKY